MLSISELRQLNWDFGGESGVNGFSNFHWYPGRFVPQLAGLLVGNLSEPGDLVLDPFCGSGTTLVEAHRLGRRVRGVDVNPVAALIARSKLLAWDADAFRKYVSELQRVVALGIADAMGSGGVVDCPNKEENAEWYGEQTLTELAVIWRTLGQVSSPYEPVGRVAFSAILRFVSSQEKHWGWICDNVKPRQLSYKPALPLFFQKMAEYRAAAELTASQRSMFTSRAADVEISSGACERVLEAYKEGSIAAVITSPPYFSMNDYTRSQRLSFLWFDFNLDASRREETGARYKRHRKAARDQYLSDMRRAFRSVARVLQPGGPCAVVIGESPHREAYLDDYLGMMKDCGFDLELSLNRKIPIQRAMSPQVKEESILIFRRQE